MFIFISVPFIIVAIAIAYLLYARMVRPSPVALGSVIPLVCVVSADEIREYCGSNEDDGPPKWRVSRKTRRGQFRVAQRYISQMVWNTKLFQQMARFEVLKIHPSKSSFDYETRETLMLRLADEAAVVRVLLLKSQISLLTRAVSTREIKAYTDEKLQELVREYKRLELDTVALVEMAREECYYAMLVERLGLSNWRLIDGDRSAS